MILECCINIGIFRCYIFIFIQITDKWDRWNSISNSISVSLIELFLNFLLLLYYFYAKLSLQSMMNEMDIYTLTEIIIYFNWIRSLWDRHSYFKIIIIQLNFGALAKRTTSIFGNIAGERCSFEFFSYLIEPFKKFS